MNRNALYFPNPLAIVLAVIYVKTTVYPEITSDSGQVLSSVHNIGAQNNFDEYCDS